MNSRRRRLLILITGVLFLIPSLFIGYCVSGYSPGTNAIRSTLETFITAQASLLAIVFSVAFVATQIVSSRYSPEFIKLFVKSPLLREALYLAIGSILVSLIGILILPILQADVRQTWFVWSISVTGGVLLSIAIYAGVFFEQTTPTNLLRQYQQQLSTNEYKEEAISAGSENSLADHPIQPVYDLTRVSIQRDELAVATEGEKTIFQIVDSTVDTLVRSGEVNEIELPDGYDDKYAQSDSYSKMEILYTPVISEYLPRVALSAADANFVELSENSIGHIGDIGVKGVKYDAHPLADISIFSLYQDIMLNLSEPINSESGQKRILHYSVENSHEIIGENLKRGHLEHFHEVSPHAYEVMRWVEGATKDENLVHNSTVKVLVDSYVDWYEIVVSNYYTELEGENPSIIEMYGNDEREQVGEDWNSIQHDNLKVSSLIHVRLHMMTTTAQHFKSIVWPEEGGTVPLFIHSAWRDLLELATQNPPRSSAILLLQRYIEIVAYIGTERDDPTYSDGYSNLMIVLRESDIILFEEAFSQILENPSQEEFHEYTSFRSLFRGIQWYPFSMYDYSDEQLETVKEIRSKLRNNYWERRFNLAKSNGSILDNYLMFEVEDWDS